MKPVPDHEVQQAYRKRIGLFLACAALVPVLVVGYKFVQTLRQLDVVERERDRWQRPDEVIRALALADGATVADFGCGSGYFALKLSSEVGRDGQVLAEDVQRLPLLFLWTRALLRHLGNVRIIQGLPDDPRLPAGTVDAVVIANTYHELTDARRILRRLSQSLRPRGRLLVVDRGPRSGWRGTDDDLRQRHKIRAGLVDDDLRQSGFEIVDRRDRFIDRPEEDELWWLIAARKP